MPLKDYIQFSDQLEQHRVHRRINGFEKPLHYQQIIIWVLLVVFALISFLILIPTLHTNVQPLMYGVISSLYFIHIVSHIVAVIIDPCDPNLLHVSHNVVVPEFDRSKFSHVIENGYCNLCNIYIINGKTKHCSICNKCIEKFDHHCKWLNHCIGARNYNGFLICILSALITCLIILFICIIELFLYFYNPTYLNLNSWTHSSKWIHVYHTSNSSSFDFDNFLYNTPLNDRIFLCIIVIQGVLTFIITILLLHLFLFHFYISYLGLTTYEYIKKFKSNDNVIASQAAPRHHLNESSNTINNTIYQNSLPVEENIFMYYLCYFCVYRRQQKDLQVPNHKITNVNSIEINSQTQHVTGWARIKNLIRRRQDETCTDAMNNNGKLTIETIENTFNQMELQNKHQKQQLRKQQKINYICKEKFLQKQSKYNNANKKDNTFCFCLNKYYYPNYNKNNIRKVIKSCKGCKYCRKKKASPTSMNNFSGFQFWRRGKKLPNRNIEYPNVRNVQCSPNIRRNQVKPLTPNETAVFIPLKSPSDEENRTLQQSPSSTSLPMLPPPNRKQLQNVSLKELGDAITSANNSRNSANNANGNSKQRKSSVNQLRTKEPNLSPIHESGLSNPSTPHMRNQKMKINKQTGQSGLWLSVDSPLASRK
uniref:Palmitoyltransferase n=1 Tax=Cacopsylla melanoneura TaxID=428564 RepID=A0A8D8YRS5_9HEMI